MSDQFKVVFTGTLTGAHTLDEVISTFAEKFRCSEDKARTLISAGKETVIKSQLDQDKAEKYQAVLLAMGLEVKVLPLKPAVTFELEDDDVVSDVIDPSSGESIKVCPKCGSFDIKDDRCLSCKIIISKYLALQADNTAPVNSGIVDYSVVVSHASSSAENTADSDSNSGYTNPYQAPEADLTQAYQTGDLSGPVSVPAGNGWRWLADGFNHFKQNPVAWIVAMIIWVLLSSIVSLVPIIGSLAITLLAPVLTAGFMLGCQAQEEGDDFRIDHLFSGFSQNVGQLMLVGLLYLVGIIVIVLAISLLVGGAVLFSGSSSQEMGAGMASAIVLPMLLGTLLIVPVVMAYWFAPALVVLNDLSAVTAMKMSFSACLKNILPGLVYSIIALLLIIVAVIPFGLGLLVIGPMMTASMYTAYRDIFYD